MTAAVGKLLRAARRHPMRSLLALAALGLAGAAAAALAWAQSHWRAAEEALRRQEFGAARAHLACYLRLWPRSAAAHLLAAQAARREAEPDAAERHLRRAGALGADRDALRRERALLRVQAGDLAAADLPLLRLAASGTDEAALVLEALARGYLRMSRLAEAFESADRLLRLQPDHLEALLCRGAVLERMNRYTDALEDYEQALRLRPDDVRARLGAGDIRLQFGHPHEAAEHFEYLAGRLPDNAAILLGLARCHRVLGRSEEARRLVEDLARRHPREPLILRERGQLAVEAGRPKEAETWLRSAVALAPHDRQTNYLLFVCLSARGRAAEAQEFLARVKRIEADQAELTRLGPELVRRGVVPTVRYQAGVLCFRLGRDEEAVSWLLSVLQDDPSHDLSRQVLAGYYERVGRKDLAARYRARPGSP